MIKKLIVVTLCLIVFEVISLATGWDFPAPFNRLCTLSVYLLLAILIILYSYRMLRKTSGITISVCLLALIAVTAYIFFLGPFIWLFFIIPISLGWLCLYMVFAFRASGNDKEKFSKVRSLQYISIIPAAFILSVLIGINFPDFDYVKDELKFKGDKYEVWQVRGSFLGDPDVTQVKQVYGPFRKSLYNEIGNEYDQLKSDKAIEDFLKSKVKSESSNKDQE